MGWDGWLTVVVVLVVLGLLIRTNRSPDVILLAGVSVLLLTRVLTPAEAVAGMSNEGMLTVGVLFVVVAGLQETGAIMWISRYVLGKPSGYATSLLRMMLPVAGMSAFLNNTPLVAMMIPAISEWTKRFQLSPSRYMIPLSYASILGGTLTLIGTSTNLVVNSMWEKTAHPSIGFFEIGKIGLPCLIVGLTYVLLVGRRRLPNRRPAVSLQDDPRSYTVEMLVDPDGPLVGKTIEGADLRHLPGLYLAEIGRGGNVLPAVSPQERLVGGDHLVFVGIVESIVDLKKIRGLTPATDQVFKLNVPMRKRVLVEAVVSNSCPLIDKTIREGRFRSIYGAVVIAVSRGGERIQKKIGDIKLRPGDTLILETRATFVEQQKNSRDFFLVSPIENSTPPRHDKAIVGMAILTLMVLVGTIGRGYGLTMLHAAILAAGLMLITRCCTGTHARQSVDWSLLIVIASALALGTAIEKTGVANTFAQRAIALAGGRPWIVLLMMYLITMALTEMITNNAAAVLVFPIAYQTAANLDVSFQPFLFALMMAASASFSTPIGYQTNLMVYGPGGYRFGDYLRIGIPLNILMCATTVLIAPLIWPF